MVSSEINNISKIVGDITKQFTNFTYGFYKVSTWCQDNSKTILQHVGDSDLIDWSNAIDELAKKQYVFTYDLPLDIAKEINDGADIDKVMSDYYFGNNAQNMKNLIESCKSSVNTELFDQIVSAYDRNEYQLACIGLYSLVDGLLENCSMKAMKNPSQESSEVDKKMISFYYAFKECEGAVIKDSLFPAITQCKCTNVDFLKILLWIDALIYFSRK